MKKPFKDTAFGKILKGGKGLLLDVGGTFLPNMTANIKREVGGEGKVHIPGAAAAWVTSIISIICTIWVIYSLIQGKDPATIKEELDLIPTGQG